MYKDPMYYYFIVPILLLLLQITVYIVFKTVKEVLESLFRVPDSDIKMYIIPDRNDVSNQKVCRQAELLKQGGSDDIN